MLLTGHKRRKPLLPFAALLCSLRLVSGTFFHLPGFQYTQQLSSEGAHMYRVACLLLFQKDSQKLPSRYRPQAPPPWGTMAPQALVPPATDAPVPYVQILPLSAVTLSVLVRCIPQ